jgi:hypothetical protein
MKRKSFFWAVSILITTAFSMTSNPLQATFDFIIAGIVPYTDISLGLFPSFAIIAMLLLLMKRWVSDLQFQMLRRQALIANAESTSKELLSAHEKERKERRQVVTQTTAKSHAH